MTSACPAARAKSTAVLPRAAKRPIPPHGSEERLVGFARAPGSAPASRSRFTTSAFPSLAATCSGVCPFASTASRSAPPAASAFAHRQSEVAWSGARPPPSLASGDAPAASIASVAHPSPRSAAANRGVLPSVSFRTFGSAPRERSASIALRSNATWSGDAPSTSSALGSAPARSIAAKHSACPPAAALCSGVAPRLFRAFASARSPASKSSTIRPWPSCAA